MLVEIDYLGEGRSDEVIARRLIEAAGHQPGRSYLRPIRGTGKANVDMRLPGLNKGAAFGRPILVLRDLDRDAPCPSALAARLLSTRHPNLLLRIAVPQVESWLVADTAAHARHCGVSVCNLPREPEGCFDLKGMIVDIAEQHRGCTLANHMAERRTRGLADWQALGEWHSKFAEERWDPARTAASGRAPSLARALGRLAHLAPA